MHDYFSVENLLKIVTQPDNIPIAFMLLIVAFYTTWGLIEARRNDKLIAQGREDEVINRMRE